MVAARRRSITRGGGSESPMRYARAPGEAGRSIGVNSITGSSLPRGPSAPL